MKQTFLRSSLFVANGIIIPRTELNIQAVSLTKKTTVAHIKHPLTLMAPMNQMQTNAVSQKKNFTQRIYIGKWRKGTRFIRHRFI